MYSTAEWNERKKEEMRVRMRMLERCIHVCIYVVVVSRDFVIVNGPRQANPTQPLPDRPCHN